MLLYLRQSTAFTIKLGPFVSATDAVTVNVGLAGSMSVLLSKAGAAFAARNDATAITYDTHGFYAVSINATDTGTTGRLQVSVQNAAHLPVFQCYTVLPANVYDSIIQASDLLQVDLQAINDSNTPADTFALAIPGVITGAIFGSTSTSSSFVTNLTELTNEHYAGGVIIMTSGALNGQRLRILAYNGSTKALTVEQRTADIPVAGDTFTIN